MRREPEVPRGKGPSGIERLDWLCEGLPLRGTCNNSFCEKWASSGSACSTSPKREGKSALMRIARLKNSPAKGLKRMVTKVQWLCWRRDERHQRNTATCVRMRYSSNTRHLGCVFQDMEPPKSLSIFAEELKHTGSQFDWFRFTRAVLRHANIRETKIHRFGDDLPRWTSSAQPQCTKIWGSVSRRDGMARSMCPREASWKLAKNIIKLKEKHETTFFSLSENCCLPCAKS